MQTDIGTWIDAALRTAICKTRNKFSVLKQHSISLVCITLFNDDNNVLA